MYLRFEIIVVVFIPNEVLVLHDNSGNACVVRQSDFCMGVYVGLWLPYIMFLGSVLKYHVLVVDGVL